MCPNRPRCCRTSIGPQRGDQSQQDHDGEDDPHGLVLHGGRWRMLADDPPALARAQDQTRSAEGMHSKASAAARTPAKSGAKAKRIAAFKPIAWSAMTVAIATTSSPKDQHARHTRAAHQASASSPTTTSAAAALNGR